MGIVETITNALQEYVVGSASAIGEAVSNLMFVTDSATGETNVSVAGTVILTITGIGFAVGLMSLVLNLIRP